MLPSSEVAAGRCDWRLGLGVGYPSTRWVPRVCRTSLLAAERVFGRWKHVGILDWILYILGMLMFNNLGD